MQATGIDGGHDDDDDDSNRPRSGTNDAEDFTRDPCRRFDAEHRLRCEGFTCHPRHRPASVVTRSAPHLAGRPLQSPCGLARRRCTPRARTLQHAKYSGRDELGRRQRGPARPWSRSIRAASSPVDALIGVGSRAMACGERHSVVVSTKGVYTFGDGTRGQLGAADARSQLTPKQLAPIAAGSTTESGVQGTIRFVAAGWEHSLLPTCRAACTLAQRRVRAAWHRARYG